MTCRLPAPEVASASMFSQPYRMGTISQFDHAAFWSA